MRLRGRNINCRLYMKHSITAQGLNLQNFSADLSLSSSYAKRKRANIGNIEYMQADILDIVFNKI